MNETKTQERGALLWMVAAALILGIVGGPCCCFFGGGFLSGVESFRAGVNDNPMRQDKLKRHRPARHPAREGQPESSPKPSPESPQSPGSP